jgi:outer membrane protein OmpA-like peptidoglycan-associated protein
MRHPAISTLLTAVALAVAVVPARAEAQDLLKKIRDQAVKRVEERKAKVDSAVVKTAAGAVDSTLEKTGRGADAVVSKVGGVAEGAITRTERGVRSALTRDDDSAELLAAQLATGHAVVREIRFAANSDQLVESAVAELKRLAKALAATPGTFLIEGHTDSLDTPETARALSERRASAVKAHLVAEGVPAARLLAVGYGAARPAADGGAGNARIELTRAQ